MKDGYTRITQILSPFTGYKSVPKDILAAKAAIGSHAHEIIKGFLESGCLWDIDDSVKGYVNSMLRFWGDGFPILETETRFYCDELMLTGEPDVIIDGPKGKTLIDWKCSLKENPTWMAQGSGYAYLAEKNGYDIQEIWFIKLDKLGNDPQVIKYKKDVPLFMKCFDLYKLFFSKEKNETIEDLIE